MSDSPLPWITGLSAFLITRAAIVGRRLSRTRHGVCVFHSPASSVDGHVWLTAVTSTQTRLECDLTNLSPGLHGFHIHEFGDLRDGCKSAGAHYNPHHTTHGGLKTHRHAGDLGNILANDDRRCTDSILVDVRLDDIIGRTLVIHEQVDDLGLGGDEESLKTGNAGARIACGVIGRASV